MICAFWLAFTVRAYQAMLDVALDWFDILAPECHGSSLLRAAR